MPVVYVDDKPECDISCNTFMMVEYEGHYYTYDAFLRWKQENPTDPFTRLEIDMHKLRRIQKR